MQNRFITRIIFILVIVFLGYWIFNGEKTSDRSEREVDGSITEKSTREDHADIEIPELIGIDLRNDKKIALFVDHASKKTGSFLIGDKVDEFIVSDITDHKVILLRGNEIIEVGLKDQTPSSETSVTRAPLRTIPPPDIGSAEKAVQSGGYSEDEESNLPEGSSNRHPATVGNLDNQ